jgi:hypothetical protein
MLKPGTLIDRFGAPSGKFVAPMGTLLPMRSLPPGEPPYAAHQVIKPIDAKAGVTAPWFGQPGMGVQYKLPASVQDLIKGGYLRQVRP